MTALAPRFRTRVFFAVEEDVAADPVGVGLFGADGIGDTFDKLSASALHEFFGFVGVVLGSV